MVARITQSNKLKGRKIDDVGRTILIPTGVRVFPIYVDSHLLCFLETDIFF